MYTWLAGNVTASLIKSKIISAEEQEIYQYGFEIGFSTIVAILCAILIGAAMGLALESVIFLVVFIPLRCSAGGYHARTYAVCFWLSNVFVALSFYFIKWGRVVVPLPGLLLIAGACSAFLWICAPVEDSNKPLDAMARKVNGKRTKVITSVYISAIILFVLLKLYTLAATITSAILLSGIMVVLGLARNKIISK